MRARTVAYGTGIAALLASGFIDAAVADPRGLWLTEGGKSHVELGPCEHNEKWLCGRIVWLENPKKDVKNKDESLRDRPLVGIDVVRDLKDEGGGKWDDGEIYNPEDGKTYDSELVEIDATTVEVSGCVWIICKEQTWKRIE